MEKLLNVTLHFGYIGVPEHIYKAKKEAKEAECAAEDA
jgi:hypothetical protein